MPANLDPRKRLHRAAGSSSAIAAAILALLAAIRPAKTRIARPGRAQPASADGRIELYPDRLVRLGLEHVEQMPRYSTRLNRLLPTESSRAPFGSPDGPSNGWEWLGPGNIGGRTRTLVIDPVNSRILYAAGITGGVWKSVDGGGRWEPLTDLLPNLTVSTLAIDPRDPEILYAGTGEISTGFGGDGIFKTSDGGATWDRLPETGTPDFIFVQRIIVSPNDSRRVYVATATGVWKSPDGGSSWSHALEPPHSPALPVYGDLAMRTDRRDDVVFAAFGSQGAEPGSIYRNLDAASSDDWAAVYSEPKMSRTSLAIAPSDEDVVYAVAASKEPERFFHGLLAVIKTTDGGDSWSSVVRNTDPIPLNTVLLSNAGGACGTPYLRNQGLYDQTIAVDPTDENRVWIGAVDLFESLDGGRNWGLNDCCSSSPDRPAALHPDFHTLVFDPRYDGNVNQNLYIGSDGGLSRIDNAASSEPQSDICAGFRGNLAWTNLNHNYGVTQFYAGTPDPSGGEFFGGTQDNGLILGSSQAGSDDWSMRLYGDAFNVVLNRRDPKILYATLLGMNILRSSDRGVSWTTVSPLLDENDRAANRVPLNIDFDDPSILWTASRRLWRTDDGGASWQAASAALRTVSTAPLTAISAPSDVSGTMLVGGSCGEIWTIPGAFESDASASPAPASPLSNLGPCPVSVTSLTWDRLREGTGYATYSPNSSPIEEDAPFVWKTTDGGFTWLPASGSGSTSLPNGIGIHTLWIDPEIPGRIYVGSDIGIFVSPDAGSSWAADGDSFPAVRTLDLVSTPDACTLFAFTHGRGAYRIPLRGGPCRAGALALPRGSPPTPVAGRRP